MQPRLPEAEPPDIKVKKKALISLAVFAMLWQVLAWFTPQYIIPGWSAIGSSLLGLRYDWVAVSMVRIFVALLLSFLAGAAGAVLMYFWNSLEGYGLPLVKMVMAVPVICWILFAVLWFRGVEFRVLFVLFTVCAPIFLVDLLDGMRGISRDLREMMWSLRPTRMEFFRKLIFPAILPFVFTGWKVNLSLAVRVVTIAELVGATSGIGFGLQLAQSDFSISDIFAWTLVLIVILLISQQAVVLLETRMLRWRAVA